MFAVMIGELPVFSTVSTLIKIIWSAAGLQMFGSKPYRVVVMTTKPLKQLSWKQFLPPNENYGFM